MKKNLLIFAAAFSFAACGSNSQKASGDASDSTGFKTEVADSYGDDADVPQDDPEEPESAEESGFPENVRVVAEVGKNQMHYNKSYVFTFELRDDGRAKIIIDQTDYSGGETTTEKIENTGSWKAREVKRGAREINAYEVNIGDGHVYFTEKFDLIWGLFNNDDVFDDFWEGSENNAWDITRHEVIK